MELPSDALSAIPESKLPAIQAAALASCTAEAHVIEGVATDPRFCRLNTTDLICTEEETESCLTVAQADALKKIYEGPINPRTGKKVYPAIESTFENQGEWAQYMISSAPGMEAQWGYWLAHGLFSNMVFDNPQWDIHHFDFDKDIEFASSKDIAGEPLSDVLSVASPDFKEIAEQGVKVIMYHGWGDVGISPRAGIRDYENVVANMGGLTKAKAFYRLFMVPGMLHCGGGPGANSFGQEPTAPALKNDLQHDIHRALEAWVEQGMAPEKIIATKYLNDNPDEGVLFTRPICPYPEIPIYSGVGAIQDANSFQCVQRDLRY